MLEAALALSLLALAGTVTALVRSAPARLLRDAREARDCADHVESEWHAERVRLTSFKAEVGATLEGVERKRKQIAAAESRFRQGVPNANGGDLQPGASSDEIRAHWTQVARERGWL